MVSTALEKGDRQAQLQAIEFSERCRDSDSEDHLVRLSQSDELWDGHRVIQGYAAKALAARGSWRPVVDYYVRWGIEALEVVNGFRQRVWRAVLPRIWLRLWTWCGHGPAYARCNTRSWIRWLETMVGGHPFGAALGPHRFRTRAGVRCRAHLARRS